MSGRALGVHVAAAANALDLEQLSRRARRDRSGRLQTVGPRSEGKPWVGAPRFNAHALTSISNGARYVPGWRSARKERDGSFDFFFPLPLRGRGSVW